MPYIDQITRGGTTYDIQDSATKAMAEAIPPMIAYEELTTTATHAYTAGNSYFTLGGVLYKATADIDIGDPIVTTGADANCQAVPGGAMGEVSDLKSATDDLTAAISSDDPVPVQKTLLNYSTDPAIVDGDVTVHDGYVLNSSGNNASSSRSMWYEFAVSPGDVYTISGRLGNYSVVLFDGAAKAKIYLIADVGAEITASGKGTYNSATKSFAGWELTIPEYDESTFAYHVDKIGITAASYTLGSVDNATPICTTTVEQKNYIRSQDLLDDITDLQNDTVYRDTPITNFPAYLKNVIAYKPTGAFAKPYICLSTDDGREGLIHQTIEMVVDVAHVPVTFCIHSHSDIFYAQKRKKYTLAEVVSAISGAITNYGCELALHDNHLWADKDATHKTSYTEKTLAQYVAEEQAFFADPHEIDTDTPLNVSWTLKSASAPEHATDPIVCGIMGGTFGMLRSGDTNLGMIKNIYDYKCVGARSNLYCLPCKNFNSGMYNTLQKCKDAVDYAIANKLVLPIFWHEAIMADSTTESDENEHISDSQIEDLLLPMIAYAKQQNVEFVTLSQIQSLV